MTLEKLAALAVLFSVLSVLLNLIVLLKLFQAPQTFTFVHRHEPAAPVEVEEEEGTADPPPFAIPKPLWMPPEEKK